MRTKLILKGSYESTVGDAHLCAPAGSVVFGPHGIFHAFKNTGTAQAQMLVFAQPAGIEQFFEELSDLSAQLCSEPGEVDPTRLPIRHCVSALVLRNRHALPAGGTDLHNRGSKEVTAFRVTFFSPLLFGIGLLVREDKREFWFRPQASIQCESSRSPIGLAPACW